MLIALILLSSVLRAIGDNSTIPILYQVPGKDLFMEFSSEATKKLVEEEMKRFDSLGKYRPL
jgi:hypothetical protein